MFEPLQMMITSKLRSSTTASRGRNSAVNQNDDSSSSPEFDYSSPESDDDNDNDDASLVSNSEIGGKQGKPISTNNSMTTMATNSIKMGKTLSPGKTGSNHLSSAPDASSPSPIETTPVGKNDETALQVSSKKVVTKAIKSPTFNNNSKETTPRVTSTQMNDATVKVTTPNDQHNQEGNVTPTPTKKPLKKKRLTSFEQLDEETQFAGETIKAATEELLKYKRAAHKSLLRDIKEKEDELKRLKESASKAEKEIEKTLERKKKASKCARDLKSKCAKVIEKAAEEKKRSKAKDAELKVMTKRSLSDTKVEEEGKNTKAGSARKKRRFTEDGKKKKRSSVKEDSSDESTGNSDSDSDDDSDADDSDWEGASRRKKASDTSSIDTPSSTRKTRVRCFNWKCQQCTLINDGANKECVACETLKPGTE